MKKFFLCVVMFSAAVAIAGGDDPCISDPIAPGGQATLCHQPGATRPQQTLDAASNAARRVDVPISFDASATCAPRAPTTDNPSDVLCDVGWSWDGGNWTTHCYFNASTLNYCTYILCTYGIGGRQDCTMVFFP